MKKIIPILCFAMIIVGYSQKKKAIADLAITHVTIIDVTMGQIRPDMTVLISKDIVVGIESSNSIKIAQGTKIIDGRGKFLIPGLWDMHVHFAADSNFCSLMIANGVTSVRDMYSNKESFAFQIDWRNKVDEAKIVGPHTYIPMAVMGPDQDWFSSTKIASTQEAIDFVKEAKTSNADFIKIFDLYDSQVITALLKEAKKEGIRVAGHCPVGLNAGDAADEGLGSFEHTYQILLSASSREDSIRSAIMSEAKRVHQSFSDLSRLLFFVQSKDLFRTYDSAKATRLFKRLKESGSYQCPTFAVFDGKLKAINGDSSIDERKKYVDQDCLKSWTSLKYNQFSATITPDDYDQILQLFKNRYQLVNDLHKAGIPILAGTDVGSGCTHHYLVPGFSLHDELLFLTHAGLTPIEALQAATKNAASALGVLNKTGTIEVGKCADLVLLNANPLENISNTRKIDAVVKSGEYFSRQELNKLLIMAEKR